MQNHDGDRTQKMEKQCNRELLRIIAKKSIKIAFLLHKCLVSFEKKILHFTNFTVFPQILAYCCLYENESWMHEHDIYLQKHIERLLTERGGIETVPFFLLSISRK